MPFFQLDNWDESGFNYGCPKPIVALWFFLQATLFRFSPCPLYGFRCCLLRLFGCKVGKGAVIRPRARFHYPWRIEIGEYTSIGDDVWLYSIAPIKIGNHSVISQKSFLCTASHDYHDPHFKTTAEPIVVGDGVWIAADVFVGPGVVIGNNSIIGARSSVFSDMPPDMVCHGSPARPVKSRFYEQ